MNNQKNVAVILAGCGVYDGSEIHEAVLTMLNLELNGASYQCFAPDMPQYHVINHLSGEESAEQRNVLVEAARIARGNIKALSEINVAEFDAVVIPGGFGAAKNLSDFAFKGAEFEIQQDVKKAVSEFIEAQKTVGLICIAPAMVGKLFPAGVMATIGNDEGTAAAMRSTGVSHQDCEVHDIVVDTQHNLVSTPAYMLGQSLQEVNQGISKLVAKLIAMA